MENLGFWAAASALALGVAGLLILSLLAARRADPAPVAARDLQVYRDQLREVERDLKRGTLAAAEAERLRTEIARRLLDADRGANRGAARQAAAPTRAGGALLLPAALVVLAAGAALWTYQRMGAPGYVDMPLAERLAAADARMRDRPAQAEVVATLTPASPPEGVTADFLDLMAQMRAAVDPAVSTDLRGLDLLARNEAALGNFADAEAAQRRLIAVKGDQALAEDHSALADILVRAAAGYVSPEAEAALAAALALDPQEGVARYYLGLMFAQGGRYDRAFAVWRALLERGPQDAPWVPFLRAQIAEVAALAGVVYEVPAPRPPPSGGLRAPSAEEIEAAADLDEEDRMAMVEGMVSQLGARLASDGGSAAEWAQLIGALGVLGRRAEAAAILEEAREIFAALPGDLALIEAAARDAGVAE